MKNQEENLKYSPDKMDGQDIKIDCKDCDNKFIWTASEQKFYREHDLEAPKRCSICREKKKAYYRKIEIKNKNT